MNVLIVDDEISAIEAVRNGIQWDKVGVQHIYVAASLQEAIHRFSECPIDILLSDIEMPMGSGLELLKWVNEHHPHVKCVFMTCHADFQFLQNALQLGSVDYILKPLDFLRVTVVLENTIKKIRMERILKENSNSWIQNKKSVIKHFWKDFFLGDIAPNKDSLTNYLRQKRLDINLENFYLPILIVTKKWTEQVTKEDQKLLQYALRNITDEFLVIPETEKEVIPFTDTSILVMLNMEASLEEQYLFKKIDASCRKLTDMVKGHIKEIICCYIGEINNIYEMPAIIESLQEMDFNNMIHESDIFFLYQVRDLNGFILTDTLINRWRDWMLQGRYVQISNEIREQLLSHGQRITRGFLKKFTMEFHFLIFEFARGRNIFVNELFGDELSNQILGEASESLEALLHWVTYAMDRMQNFDKMNTNWVNPVDRTKDFIHLHLSEELSMEHIANNVHLNADYLTRIFKREVGVSISKYMINKKMEVAKELLIHTDKSIGEIAMLVGYYNYSSFNRIFTKETGMSPQKFKISNVTQ
ncbi:response regulator transcription factor [Paenibacillus xylanexedens]|uniref:response regulator transcription factor n=1 Tax=Paenibacillus xylanexedens TaxID=528191 RepID=UPI003B014C35